MFRHFIVAKACALVFRQVARLRALPGWPGDHIRSSAVMVVFARAPTLPRHPLHGCILWSKGARDQSPLAHILHCESSSHIRSAWCSETFLLLNDQLALVDFASPWLAKGKCFVFFPFFPLHHTPSLVATPARPGSCGEHDLKDGLFSGHPFQWVRLCIAVRDQRCTSIRSHSSGSPEHECQRQTGAYIHLRSLRFGGKDATAQLHRRSLLDISADPRASENGFELTHWQQLLAW